MRSWLGLFSASRVVGSSFVLSDECVAESPRPTSTAKARDAVAAPAAIAETLLRRRKKSRRLFCIRHLVDDVAGVHAQDRGAFYVSHWRQQMDQQTIQIRQLSY